MSKELIELNKREKKRIMFCDEKSADMIEQQQSWIASLEQNARDADRMYKELETELAEQQKRIDDMNSLCAFNERTMDEMLARLAASQAQIKVLRDALEKLTHNNFDTYDEVAELAFAALAQPTDDSALRELLAAEREKCAVVCERLISGDGICADKEVWIHDCSAAIRAMGSES